MSEYIITKEQIEELNRAHGGMKIVTSWLSCYAIWDTSNTYPVMKSEHVAVDLPEIVRCRDCKWFTPEHRYEEEREYGVMETLVDPPDCGNPERCNHHYDSATGKYVPVHIVTEPDGFCKWGERRQA